SNQDNAIGRFGSIDSSTWAVFQDRYALNIIGIDIIHRTFDTVNDDQGIRIVDGTQTTDANGTIVFTRLARVLRNRHAGKFSLYSRRHIGHWTILQIF